MGSKIVLASSSPYRKQLLARTSLEFVCASPNIDESVLPGESPMELVKRLSTGKAEALVEKYPNALIIGSDQVAEFQGKIVGKPASHADAESQLRQFSGSVLTLHAGVTLINARTGKIQSDADIFEVEFRMISNTQIERYLNLEKPYDCCGSLKAEGMGIALLKRLSGNDPNTLIGLPLIKLINMLMAEGVELV